MELQGKRCSYAQSLECCSDIAPGAVHTWAPRCGRRPAWRRQSRGRRRGGPSARTPPPCGPRPRAHRPPAASRRQSLVVPLSTMPRHCLLQGVLPLLACQLLVGRRSLRFACLVVNLQRCVAFVVGPMLRCLLHFISNTGCTAHALCTEVRSNTCLSAPKCSTCQEGSRPVCISPRGTARGAAGRRCSGAGWPPAAPPPHRSAGPRSPTCRPCP